MPFVCVSVCCDSMFMCIDLDCGLEDLKLWCFNLHLLSDFVFFCGVLRPSQRPGFGSAVSRMNYDVLHQSQSYYSCSFALGRGSRGWMELLSDFTVPQRIYISEGPGCHAGARLCLTLEL